MKKRKLPSDVFGQSVLFYTTAGNERSERVLDEILKILPEKNLQRKKKGEKELNVRCQVLGKNMIAKLNGTPSVVLFDDRYHEKFSPTALGKHTTGLRKKMPEWAAQKTTFGIRIGTHCTEDHIYRNCAFHAISWFVSERFIEEIKKGNYPWGAPGKRDQVPPLKKIIPQWVEA